MPSRSTLGMKRVFPQLLGVLSADSPQLSPALETGLAKGSHLTQGHVPLSCGCIQCLIKAGMGRYSSLTPTQSSSEGPSQLLSCPWTWLRSPTRPHYNPASPFAGPCFHPLSSTGHTLINILQANFHPESSAWGAQPVKAPCPPTALYYL